MITDVTNIAFKFKPGDKVWYGLHPSYVLYPLVYHNGSTWELEYEIYSLDDEYIYTLTIGELVSDEDFKYPEYDSNHPFVRKCMFAESKFRLGQVHTDLHKIERGMGTVGFPNIGVLESYLKMAMEYNRKLDEERKSVWDENIKLIAAGKNIRNHSEYPPYTLPTQQKCYMTSCQSETHSDPITICDDCRRRYA